MNVEPRQVSASKRSKAERALVHLQFAHRMQMDNRQQEPSFQVLTTSEVEVSPSLQMTCFFVASSFRQMFRRMCVCVSPLQIEYDAFL